MGNTCSITDKRPSVNFNQTRVQFKDTLENLPPQVSDVNETKAQKKLAQESVAYSSTQSAALKPKNTPVLVMSKLRNCEVEKQQMEGQHNKFKIDCPPPNFACTLATWVDDSSDVERYHSNSEFEKRDNSLQEDNNLEIDCLPPNFGRTLATWSDESSNYIDREASEKTNWMLQNEIMLTYHYKQNSNYSDRETSEKTNSMLQNEVLLTYNYEQTSNYSDREASEKTNTMLQNEVMLTYNYQQSSNYSDREASEKANTMLQNETMLTYHYQKSTFPVRRVSLTALG